jgi:hypothetical protein
VHGDYLQAFLDIGIIGLTLLFLLYLTGLKIAWDRRKESIAAAAGAAILALMVSQCFSFVLEKIASLVWMAGVFAILNSPRSEHPMVKLRMPVWMHRSIGYVLAILMAIFALASLTTIRCDAKFYNASQQSSITSDDLDDLMQRMRSPWIVDANMLHVNTHTWAVKAAETNAYDIAGQFAEEAYRLHPADHLALGLMAGAAYARNDIRAAQSILEEWVHLFGPDPYSPALKNLVALYKSQKENDKANALTKAMAEYTVRKPDKEMPVDREIMDPSVPEFTWQPCSNEPDMYYCFNIWKQGTPEPTVPMYPRVRDTKLRLGTPLDPGETYFWRVKAIGKYWTEKAHPWVITTSRNKAPSESPDEQVMDAIESKHLGPETGCWSSPLPGDLVELASKAESLPMTDGINLLAFRQKASVLGKPPRIYFLFKVDSNIPMNTMIYATAAPDDEDRSSLPANRRVAGNIGWAVDPIPRMDGWKTGYYLLACNGIRFTVPYQLYVVLVRKTDKISYPQYGDRISLGWWRTQ